MTEDELVEAIRQSIVGRKVPPPASRAAIAETELAAGYPLPPLLARLFLEVANGGFGPGGQIYGVSGHDWHSNGIFSDMTEAAREAVKDPDWRRRRWCLPLFDWGCSIMTLIDCRDASGPLWGWDPHRCCLDHAFFPLDQSLAAWLTESLNVSPQGPFYTGYSNDLRSSVAGCGPLEWASGRIKVTRRK